MIFLYLILSIILGIITTWILGGPGDNETFFTMVWIVNGFIFFISTLAYSIIFSIVHFILTKV